MTNEIEVVRETISSVTGAPFRVDEIRENRLLLKKQAVWFVWCGDFAYADEVDSLKAAWKNRAGDIWLETSEIADMIALVEREYGEKGTARMPDLEPGIPPSGEIPEEVVGYPRVVSVLKECQRKLAELMKKTGVELKPLYDGGVGVTTLRIGARVGPGGVDSETLQRQVMATAEVLKNAYDLVTHD